MTQRHTNYGGDVSRTETVAGKPPAPKAVSRETLYLAHRWLDDRGGAGTVRPDGSVIAHGDTSPPSFAGAFEALAKVGAVEITDDKVRVTACFG